MKGKMSFDFSFLSFIIPTFTFCFIWEGYQNVTSLLETEHPVGSEKVLLCAFTHESHMILEGDLFKFDAIMFL